MTDAEAERTVQERAEKRLNAMTDKRDFKAIVRAKNELLDALYSIEDRHSLRDVEWEGMTFRQMFADKGRPTEKDIAEVLARFLDLKPQPAPVAPSVAAD